ncbi:MAG: beta-glucanase (GH16 family) [Rhodothermales bacterium]|jgi:beta-glucanase (GH16 family)
MRYPQVLSLLGLVAAALTLSSCQTNRHSTTSAAWRLVWQDEFSGTEGQSPDPTKWTYDIGTDWGNAQLEYDTDRPENVSLDGMGNLVIAARRESYQGQEYTSARIATRDLYEPTYGRIEARLSLPAGAGIWPAFWMLGANIDEVGWPQCGKFDAVEYFGRDPDTVFGAVHGPGYTGDAALMRTFQSEDVSFQQEFHTYTVDWSADRFDWYVDGLLYHTTTAEDLPGEWVFDHPFYLILDVAVGGGAAGNPDETTIFPARMLVDWVRVYQKSP